MSKLGAKLRAWTSWAPTTIITDKGRIKAIQDSLRAQHSALAALRQDESLTPFLGKPRPSGYMGAEPSEFVLLENRSGEYGSGFSDENRVRGAESYTFRFFDGSFFPLGNLEGKMRGGAGIAARGQLFHHEGKLLVDVGALRGKLGWGDPDSVKELLFIGYDDNKGLYQLVTAAFTDSDQYRGGRKPGISDLKVDFSASTIKDLTAELAKRLGTGTSGSTRPSLANLLQGWRNRNEYEGGGPPGPAG
jgi:hypothetical protein